MIDRERLQEMLHIAPFHRWLGLEIATCSDQRMWTGVQKGPR